MYTVHCTVYMSFNNEHPNARSHEHVHEHFNEHVYEQLHEHINEHVHEQLNKHILTIDH